jgi:hypothetical protein
MSSVKIADGWNQTPIELELLSPPLFANYAADESVLTKWEDSEEIEANGDREDVEIGKPIAIWQLDIMTREEMAYWKTEFGNRVSITTLNRSDNTYHTYNAKMRKVRTASLNYESGLFEGVEISFYDLVLVP